MEEKEDSPAVSDGSQSNVCVIVGSAFPKPEIDGIKLTHLGKLSTSFGDVEELYEFPRAGKVR